MFHSSFNRSIHFTEYSQSLQFSIDYQKKKKKKIQLSEQICLPINSNSQRFTVFQINPPRFPLKFTTVIKIEWQISNHKKLESTSITILNTISVQMHCRYSTAYIVWHSGQGISKKEEKKNIINGLRFEDQLGGFHLVIKWTATEFLETFSTVLRYLEDIFEEFRIYPSRKKVFWNFFSFLFFFAFFFFLKKFASENVWITLARC